MGIPIGLIFGYLAGLCMAPSLTADAQISAQAGKTAQTVVSANPLIFLAAILLTVYFPVCRLVKWWKEFRLWKQLHLAEGEQSQKKIKKNTSVTWWGMAVQNVAKLEKGIDCYEFRSFYGSQLYCDVGAGI